MASGKSSTQQIPLLSKNALRALIQAQNPAEPTWQSSAQLMPITLLAERMSSLRKLQDWYLAQCDGDWEHGSGVKIDTLDNPGWSVTIDLAGTILEERMFEPVSYGVGSEAVEGSDDWLLCRIEGKKFKGRGGPQKLEEILEIFLRWKETANQAIQPTPGKCPASKQSQPPGVG